MDTSVQWQGVRMVCVQAGQGPRWHRRLHRWVHPAGRDRAHPSSHTAHSGPACRPEPVTAWHTSEQVWFPHTSNRPHARPHEEGRAA